MQFPRATHLLLGLIGTKAEAEEIKDQLKTFLKESLNLEMSKEKTLITHATQESARFLGYDITCTKDDTARNLGRRAINGQITPRVPAKVVEEKCALYMQNGKPVHRTELIDDDDFSIIARYQAEYRGIVQYYTLAQNLAWFSKLNWVMRGSLLKTLSRKHKASIKRMVQKYASKTITKHGPRKCLEIKIERPGKKPLVARFGGIPLIPQKRAVIIDQKTRLGPYRNELIKRLLAEKCELCGSTENLEVHHIRKLIDLRTKEGQEAPSWKQYMAARKRKTLVTCRRCHHDIHKGRPVEQSHPQ